MQFVPEGPQAVDMLDFRHAFAVFGVHVMPDDAGQAAPVEILPVDVDAAFANVAGDFFDDPFQGVRIAQIEQIMAAARIVLRAMEVFGMVFHDLRQLRRAFRLEPHQEAHARVMGGVGNFLQVAVRMAPCVRTPVAGPLEPVRAAVRVLHDFTMLAVPVGVNPEDIERNLEAILHEVDDFQHVGIRLVAAAGGDGHQRFENLSVRVTRRLVFDDETVEFHQTVFDGFVAAFIDHDIRHDELLAGQHFEMR